MKKLGCKENERLHFILVHDVKPSNSHSHSAAASRNPVIMLQKPLRLVEKLVPQIKLVSSRNKPVHLLSHNARGYAVFMEINYRETPNSPFRKIRAQFIDVDLNKISATCSTKEEAIRKIKSIKANPSEQIQSITVKRTKHGQYRLVVHRTRRKIAQLKKQFLNKHGNLVKHAMIVETSNGYHIYWALRDGAVSKFVPIQKALAQKFNSDPLITNLARVMRIPGFYHMKDPNTPFMVRVVQWGRKKRFTQEELIRTFRLEP
ncbi:ribosomal protein L18 [Paenibacillus harenae]|nr:ribosomal protein L18 [Paenibacillus harenae]